MTTVNVYLSFDGNCEEAFNFYKAAFGGDFSFLGRFKDIPPTEGIPPISEEQANRVMHISLPISKETIIMGSDTGSWGPQLSVGNNFSVSISADSKENADKFFTDLSDGGKVSMPMESTFWGSYFGSFIDKFGINWMVSFNEN